MAFPDDTTDRDLAQAEAAIRQRLLSAAARFDASNGDHQAMVELDVAVAFDPESLVGQEVRVFWPEDEAWYLGSVVRYDSKSAEHAVHYVDGTKEVVIMAIERVRVILTVGQDLPRPSLNKVMDYASRLEARAASAEPAKAMKLRLRAGQIRSFVAAPSEPGPSTDGIQSSPTKYTFGSVVWGRVKGYPPWPALVVTRDHVLQGQQPSEKFAARIANTVPVVYFGSFERQHVRMDHVTALREGIKAGYCIAKTTKRRMFGAAICEVEAWLSDGELPEGMFPCNDEPRSDEDDEEDEVLAKGGCPRRLPSKRARKVLGRSSASWRAKAGAIGMPMRVGSSLKVLSLGHIEWLHPGFHNEKAIWPVGYRAIRIAATPAAGGDELQVPHICEILAAPDGSGPIFRVTPEGSDPVEARSPAKAWSLLFKRPRGQGKSNGRAPARSMEAFGARHFGLTVPRVVAAILGLPGAERCERFSGWPDGAHPPTAPPLTENDMLQRLRCEAACCRLPDGIHGVPLGATPPGVCTVCFEEEEDDTDLVLQCDDCGIFVHMLCYGVREPPLGRLWMCDVCRVASNAHGGGTALSPPACALCPVVAGAMKRTTCGRWAHLTCALWMDGPALDRKLEYGGLEGLVAGVASVHPSRYRLTCVICRQAYGACVQCCDPSCYACFHILCARQAGYRMHVEGGDVSEGSDEDADWKVVSEPVDSAEENGRASSSLGPEAHGDENTAVLHNNNSHGLAQIETATGKEEPVHKIKPHAKINGKKKSKSARRQAGKKTAMSINGAQLMVYCSKHTPCDGQTTRAPDCGAAAVQEPHALHGPCSFEHPVHGGAGKGFQLPTAVTRWNDGMMHGARAASLHDRLHRGHREPEALAAALTKRRFIQAVPLLLGGSGVLGPAAVNNEGEIWNVPKSRSISLLNHSHRAVETASTNQRRGVDDDPEGEYVIVDGDVRQEQTNFMSSYVNDLVVVTAVATPQGAHPNNNGPTAVSSTNDRYHEMRRTEHQRIVPGKSAIHGWGAFARVPHSKGQMVIEYIGDLVRPSVADSRERAMYDSLVGAGTYVFRLNAQECVDATRAGNLAHLLNHSCNPNCYSRTVQVWHEPKKRAVDRVVIFALRDIAAWEELTYDYRFLGEEVLRCACGTRSCRGMVNERLPGRRHLLVPRSQVRPYVIAKEEK